MVCQNNGLVVYLLRPRKAISLLLITKYSQSDTLIFILNWYPVYFAVFPFCFCAINGHKMVKRVPEPFLHVLAPFVFAILTSKHSSFWALFGCCLKYLRPPREVDLNWLNFWTYKPRPRRLGVFLEVSEANCCIHCWWLCKKNSNSLRLSEHRGSCSVKILGNFFKHNFLHMTKSFLCFLKII